MLPLVGNDLLCQITLVKRMANRSEPSQSIGACCHFLITKKLQRGAEVGLDKLTAQVGYLAVRHPDVDIFGPVTVIVRMLCNVIQHDLVAWKSL